jgi:hypothetical protein
MTENGQTLFLNGFAYKLNAKYKDREYYRCARREADSCKVTLILCAEETNIKGTHCCGGQVQIKCEKSKQQVAEHIREAARDMSLSPQDIYERLLRDCRCEKENAIVCLPTKRDIMQQVRAHRASAVSKDTMAVEMDEHRLLDGRPFLRRSWSGDIHGHYQRVLLWATDDSLAVLRCNGQIFIDATFRVVPHGFAQLLIVMAFDRATNIYCPCAYALMTSRCEYLYCVVFHELVVLLEYGWDPSVVVTDFEKALVKAVKYQFKDSTLLGCYFHFKQALFRKMQKFGIDRGECAKASADLDILTLVDQSKLGDVIHNFRSKTASNQCWQNFWVYFARTWMDRFPPALWNISQVANSLLSGRTNNCVERYNRRIGEKFPHAHPPLLSLISVMKAEFTYYFLFCARIRSGEEPLPTIIHDFVRPSLESFSFNLLP